MTRELREINSLLFISFIFNASFVSGLFILFICTHHIVDEETGAKDHGLCVNVQIYWKAHSIAGNKLRFAWIWCATAVQFWLFNFTNKSLKNKTFKFLKLIFKVTFSSFPKTSKCGALQQSKHFGFGCLTNIIGLLFLSNTSRTKRLSPQHS